MTKQPHYYSEEQTSPLRLKKIKARLRGKEFEFYTAGGVFSPKKIDRGTKLLIESAIIKPGWKVLDLGCGYGAVGIVIAVIFPETDVLLTDINRRAFQLAKQNIDLNKAYNAKTVRGDMYEKISKRFDTILLNPPQTAGKQVCFEMIEKAPEYLEKGGMLQLVARHQKGGKELEKKMLLVFKNVKEVDKKGGYRVYVSEKV